MANWCEKKLILLFFLFSNFLFYTCSNKIKNQSETNIAFIFADAQLSNTIHTYGNNEIITTNLDKLAQENNFFQTKEDVLHKAVSVKPHKRQYEWQKNEFTAFIHFGVNTFTGREWGTGFEDTKIFNPTHLDTDQWCEAIKSAGMKLVIITAKHHDGFCLWQTRYTKHSVASSNWRNGKGDVLKELSKSCKKYGLKLGVYLSPADLYQIENKNGLYGNGSRYSERIIPRKVSSRPFKNKRTFKFKVDDYNEYFMNQLFELLTEYGPIYEVWFDGAHPKRKGGQTYTYNQWYKLIRELAPQAVIFGRGPDVRWCGNEAGKTRQSEWSVIPINGKPDNWQWPDMTDDNLGSISKIRSVLEAGGFLHWYPAETNTSIRHGWFWRDESQYVKSVDEILNIWYRSVGGNTVFLLNIPPNTKGLLAERDVKVLRKVGAILKKTFTKNLAAGAAVKASSIKDKNHKAGFIIDDNLNTCWMPNTSDTNLTLEITLPTIKKFNRIVIQEQIQDYSQRISAFEIFAKQKGSWRKIANGTTVGYKRICKIQTVKTDRIKIKILSSRLEPTINNFGLFFEEPRISNPIITRNKEGFVSIKCKPEGPIIRFTTDGTKPNETSTIFTKKIKLQKGGIVEAICFLPDAKIKSEITKKEFDIAPAKWKVVEVSSEQADNNESASNAIDGDENTHWITRWKPNAPTHPHYITIDLGENLKLKGFTYAPRKGLINGTIKEYIFYVSTDGKNWENLIHSKFDNIRNNPVKQKVYFEKPVEAKYIKLVALSEVNGNPWTSAGEIGIITR